MKAILLTALVAAALPLAATAQDGPITVSDAYARSASPMAGAAFMQIRNAGTSDCTLLGAATDAAEVVQLHTHRDMGDGVVRMVHVEEGFPIPAGQTHLLARGGDHVMLMGLTQPLATGDSVTLTLDFGECGAVELVVPVDNEFQGPEAAMPAGEDAAPAPSHEAPSHGDGHSS